MHVAEDPTSIDSLAIPGCQGCLGMTACPGTWRGLRLFSPGAEALAADLDSLLGWQPRALVTLVEYHELEWLGLTALPDEARQRGLAWYHLPIPDFHAPGAQFESRWLQHGEDIRRHLALGERVVLHCLAGLGRTGTVAARLLIEHGVPPNQALRQVREARPGAVQSRDQLDYVLTTPWIS